MVKGILRQDLTPHQPVEEGTSRTRVGLDRTFGAHLAAAGRRFAHGGEPGIDVRRIDFSHQRNLPLILQEGLQEAERGLMPLQGLGAGVAAFMIEQVIGNGLLHRCAGASLRQYLLLALFPLRVPGRGSIFRRVLALLILGVEPGALSGGARFRDMGRGCVLSIGCHEMGGPFSVSGANRGDERGEAVCHTLAKAVRRKGDEAVCRCRVFGKEKHCLLACSFAAWLVSDGSRSACTETACDQSGRRGSNPRQPAWKAGT